MSTNLGSLGDLFREQGKDMKCRVRGCNNLVHISGERALRNKTGNGHSRQDGLMCDECWAYFNTLEDRQMPCSKPGCDGTWTWNRYQQLEAHVQGHDDQAPRGLCEKCRNEARSRTDVEEKCRIKGCGGTWKWTARMQLESRDGKPPRRLCDDCFRIFNTLRDRELACRVKGCKGHFLWNRYQQLEHIRAGRSQDEPPARMCPDCLKKLNSFQPQELPCKVGGCKNTWTWTPFEQLEAAVNTPEGQPVEPPKRMCRECVEFLHNAQDSEQPCANRGCGNKWVWTRGMQLAAKLHGRTEAPRRICEHCRKELEQIQPVECGCAVEGCPGKWIYTPEQQLRDRLAKRQPEPRFCTKCQEFLASHKAEHLTCEKCGRAFSWSAREQLYTSLGTFQKPHFCAECNSHELSQMPPPKEVVIKAEQPLLRITIPTGGAWNSTPQTRDWPDGMTGAVVAKMENAAPRVVCTGDETTIFSNDDCAGWVAVLSRVLQEKYPGCGVVNSGMAQTTMALLNLRAERDILPFAPQLVIFSTALADSRAVQQGAGAEEQNARLAAMGEAFGQFVQKMRSLEKQPALLCYLPNPIFPQKDGRNGQWRNNENPDQEAVRIYEAVLRSLRTLCKEHNVHLVDGKALFEMVGQKTAVSWMSDACNPNADGCRNIAGWLLAEITGNALL